MQTIGRWLIYLGAAVLVIWGLILFFTNIPEMPLPLKIGLVLLVGGAVLFIVGMLNRKKPTSKD